MVVSATVTVYFLGMPMLMLIHSYAYDLITITTITIVQR